MVHPVGYAEWQARKSSIPSPHFTASIFALGPLRAVGPPPLPEGRTAPDSRAIASGISGPTVRTTLVVGFVWPVFVVFGAATTFLVVRVVFLGGMAKPHLLSATGPRRRLALTSRSLVGS